MRNKLILTYHLEFRTLGYKAAHTRWPYFGYHAIMPWPVVFNRPMVNNTNLISADKRESIADHKYNNNNDTNNKLMSSFPI